MIVIIPTSNIYAGFSMGQALCHALKYSLKVIPIFTLKHFMNIPVYDPIH